MIRCGKRFGPGRRGGQHLWARGYFAASVGTVTDEVVKEYIEKQDVSPSDDDFKISDWL